jgi:urease accessory protein
MPLNAALYIETGLQEGRTILRNSYCTQPFKLANITEDKQQKELHLMLMSSSPGVLDGDVYSRRLLWQQHRSCTCKLNPINGCFK